MDRNFFSINHAEELADDFPEYSKVKINFKVPNKKSLGFKLDKKNLKPFAFLSDSPPKDIAKMCDAIVILFHEEKKLYFSNRSEIFF